jgi:Tol biopolymer transport system component
LGKLQVVPLDGRDVQHVARFGFSPNWSLDSQRVYYMRTEKEWGDSADVYMYDLNMGTDTKILSSPLCTSDGTELHMWQFPLALSPFENAAAIFASGSLWLVAWSH